LLTPCPVQAHNTPVAQEYQYAGRVPVPVTGSAQWFT
jgi:hypothetical protein